MEVTAGATRRDGVPRARRIVLALLTAELIVLVVTGVALYFVYRPSGAGSPYGAFFVDTRWDADLASAVRTVHRVTSQLAVITALAAAVLLVVGPGAPLRRWTGHVHAAGIVLVTLAASVTGMLLPYDQLGLWAVTVGTTKRGYGLFFEDDIRFAIVGGAQITPSTLARWLLAHAVVLGAALTVLVALAWRAERYSPSAARRRRT